MLNFVSRVFEGFIEVILWLNLIVCAIAGAVMMGMRHDISYYSGSTTSFNFGLGFLGLILGAAVGLILDIVYGGVLVTFVKMGKDIAKIKKKISQDDFENNGIKNEVFETDYTDKTSKKLFDEELKTMDL